MQLVITLSGIPAGSMAQNPSLTDVAVYMDEGAWEAGVIAFERFLEWKGLTHRRVDASYVNIQNLTTSFRSIYFPGGYAYDYKLKISARGEENIRDLVRSGGAYIGICAGAYFASDRVDWEGGSYPYTLGLFKGTARGSLSEIQAWPGYSMTGITMNSRSILGSASQGAYRTLYFGGPAFVPDPGIVVDTVATWDDAADQCAIISFSYGSGRALLIGPHPEIEENSGRDGTDFGAELNDPESEWGFLWAAMDWALGRPVTDTSTAHAGQPGIANEDKAIRLSFFPNPMNESGVIEIVSRDGGNIVLSVIDVLGRTVWEAPETALPAGVARFPLNRADLKFSKAAGICFLSLLSHRTANILLLNLQRR